MVLVGYFSLDAMVFKTEHYLGLLSDLVQLDSLDESLEHVISELMWVRLHKKVQNRNMEEQTGTCRFQLAAS